LRRAAWDHGYATEAATPVLHHGLHALRLGRVIAEIDPSNVPSQRVAEKIGLRRRGIISAADRISIRYDIEGQV
jgi:RimJ/RimL family protein N-acetyltransferase